MVKQFPYIGNSETEQQAILDYLGIKSAEDLFVDIPKEYRDSNLSEIPSSISEMELVEHLNLLSEKNITPNPAKSFIGKTELNTAWRPLSILFDASSNICKNDS